MKFSLAIVTPGTIRTEYSGAVFGREKPESLDVWACLGIIPPDMPGTPYLASEKNQSQQPTIPHHPTLKPSYVHYSSHQRTALFLSYCNST